MLYHLFLVFLSTPYLELCLSPKVHISELDIRQANGMDKPATLLLWLFVSCVFDLDFWRADSP